MIPSPITIPTPFNHIHDGAMKHFFTYWFAAITLLGCQKIDLVDYSAEPQGEAIVDVMIGGVSGVGNWSEATKAYELTPQEEAQIKSIEILVFNSSGALVSRQRIESPSTSTHRISTRAGNSMSIYVVTNTTLTVNASNSPIDVLGQVTTLDDLKNIKVTNLLVDASNNRTLVMSGSADNVTIAPGSGNTISIPLNYIAAKMTVNVVESLPLGETFELTDWRLGSLALYTYIFPRPTDAVNPSNGADFITQSVGSSWSDTTLVIDGANVAAKTTTFYVFENRRGTTSNSDPKLKSGSTAPAAASKFIARGYYKTITSVKGVNINLMFGANSTNDYNVERTKRYVYTVKIKGFNQFDVDTRYTDAGVGFSAEVASPTLDAHYDFRPLKISAYSGTSTATILDANGNPTSSSFWLKMSSKDITKFVDNGSGTYIRPTYNPTLEMLQTLSAVHISPNSMSTNTLYLYADEYLVDGATRTAQVRITNVQLNGVQLSPITITISQRGVLLAGDVGLRVINPSNTQTTTNYRLATEVIEEAKIAITPGNLANERTSTMQWGFSGSTMTSPSPYTLRNGYDNTLAWVLSNTTTGALRTPYGRTGSSTITYDQYDPIYNTYAARYCFEKNRDLNGDGVIVGSEIKWYLPSTEEQLLIFVGLNSWSTTISDRWTPNNIYSSSTTYSTGNNMAIVYSSGMTGTTPISITNYVRCVRQI